MESLQATATGRARATLTPIFSALVVVLSVGIALAYQANQTVPQAVGTPYDRWLKEDVVYIITPQELAAFQSLGSDAEREHMMEQFWQRRDRGLKDEHYRRIAFANQHYSAGNLAGWETDRGRIYITYGPPDEIDSHPSGEKYTRPAEQGGGATTVYPFEQWRYRHIEGIGDQVIMDFVDITMTGEYRMTFDPSEKENLLIRRN